MTTDGSLHSFPASSWVPISRFSAVAPRVVSCWTSQSAIFSTSSMYLLVSLEAFHVSKLAYSMFPETLKSQLGRSLDKGSLRRDLDSLSQSVDIILLVLLDILQEFGVGSGHIVE
jgi:hypothetical protein